jgi:hypothetical protein
MSETDVQNLAESLRPVVEAAATSNITARKTEYAVLWWEPYGDGTGAVGQTEIREREDFAFVVDFLRQHPKFGEFRKVLEDVRRFKTQPYVNDQTAERLFHGYLMVARSVSVNDETLSRVCKKCLEDINSDEYIHDGIFQLHGYQAPGSFKITDDISLRPITKDDITRYCAEPLPVRNDPRIWSSDWICTINQKVDRSAHIRIWESAYTVLNAVGMVKEGCARMRLIQHGPVSPYLVGRHAGSEQWRHSSPEGNRMTFDENEINQLVANYKRIARIYAKKEKHRFVAMRRFRSACERTEIEDKLIDLVIALESLLIPHKSAEIGYRFRLRGASFLPDRLGDLVARIQLMKELYEARSSAVHSDAGDDVVDHRLLNRAVDVFREIFNRLISESVSVEKVIADLDKAMVQGGTEWLRKTGSSANG